MSSSKTIRMPLICSRKPNVTFLDQITSGGIRIFQMGAPTFELGAKTYYLVTDFVENYMK